MEREVISGVAYSRDEAKVTLLRVPDIPGIAAKVFEPLSQASVNVDMIVQNISADGEATDLTFTVSRADLDKSVKAVENIEELKGIKLMTSNEVAKVSIVGIGMISHHGVASKMFETLAENGINIQVITTSEIKISVLVDEKHVESAVSSLHAAYGLEE